MTNDDGFERVRRRPLLKSIGATTMVGLAGCSGQQESGGGQSTPTSTPTSTETTTGTATSTPSPTTQAETTAETTTDSGSQTGLSSAEIDALVDAFDDQPFGGGQDTPEHVWKWVNEDVLLFLHFDAANPREATGLRWLGIGVREVFSADARPGGSAESGFTHFHQFDAPEWEAGHGGEAGAEGAWLLHVGTDTFEAPWGTVNPGVDYAFMPTPPPNGGSGSAAKQQGAKSLSSDEINTLVDVFDDQPFTGGQDTPEHVWKQVTENVIAFLHFDAPDPREATALRWYGIGVKGRFFEEEKPHPDFTHFHQENSETWDGGHGGEPGAGGYWLLHVGTDTFEAPWGTVNPGVDRAFMPTPAPSKSGGSSGESGGSSDVAEVSLVSQDDESAPFAYDPAETTVSAGTTIRWTNDTDVFHTVTATDSLEERTPNGQFAGTLSSSGDTFEFAFEEPGTYHYYCEPHAGFMAGIVTVE